MEQEKLQWLADYVAGISPELWDVTLKYVYAAAIQWLILSIVLSIVSIGLIIILKKYTDDDDEIKEILYFLLLFLIVISTVCIISAVGRFISPEMYAIKYLLHFPL